jgi:D-psicose/D-tagatose/L-ribulose 3-epimerase
MPKLGFDSPAPDTYASPAEFEAALTTLARLGFDGVEIGVADPARLDLRQLRESLTRSGMALCGVLTGASYFAEGLCLISPDAAVRARAVERLKAHLDWTAPLGATVVVGQMQGMRSDEPDRQRANERLIAAMRQVAAHAEACGGHVVLEAVNRHEVAHNYTAAEVLEVVEAVNSPAFNAMLDTYHINIEECSLDGPVRLVGSRLGYVHVVENHRGRIGSGHLDLALILRTTLEIGYAGYWVCGDFYGPGDIGERAGAAIAYLRRHDLLR